MRLGLRKAGILWPLLAAILLTACAEEAATPVDDGKIAIEAYGNDDRRATPEALVGAAAIDPAPVHQAFAFNEFRGRAGDGNTLTAPFDTQQFLAGLALGAAGESLQVIANAGGWPSLGDSARDEILAGVSLWEQRIAGLDAIERRRWLWGQGGYRFHRDYLRAQAELFGPEMAGLDFRGDSDMARAAIEDDLEGRLTMEDIGDRSRLVLAQTTRLRATWPADLGVEPFEGRFGEHEEQRWVPMLRISGGLSVAEGEDYRAVAVPFAEDGLSLVVITPAPEAFDTVRDRLDADFWRQLDEGLMPAREATLNLPLFSLDRTLYEKPQLGIAQSEHEADFSPVNGAGFLYLEPLQQSIELDVSEAGLNATTATVAVHTATWDEPAYLFNSYSSFGVLTEGIWGFLNLVARASSIPCYYPPDQRPFLFAVYAHDTATLLHVGQVRTLNGPTVEADWYVPYWTACGDSPLVEVYQYKGSRQCVFGSGTPYWEMEQTLTAAGIDVIDAWEGSDGKDYLQVCEGPDGMINIFSIHESQLAAAEALGFQLLSSLKGE